LTRSEDIAVISNFFSLNQRWQIHLITTYV
jgi:hypothetical protein